MKSNGQRMQMQGERSQNLLEWLRKDGGSEKHAKKLVKLPAAVNNIYNSSSLISQDRALLDARKSLNQAHSFSSIKNVQG